MLPHRMTSADLTLSILRCVRGGRDFCIGVFLRLSRRYYRRNNRQTCRHGAQLYGRAQQVDERTRNKRIGGEFQNCAERRFWRLCRLFVFNLLTCLHLVIKHVLDEILLYN